MCHTATYPLSSVLHIPCTAAYLIHALLYVSYSCLFPARCPLCALYAVLYLSFSYLSTARYPLCFLKLPIPCPMSSMCPIQLPILYTLSSTVCVLQLHILYTLSSICPRAAYPRPAVLYVPYTAAAYPLHTLLYISYSCPAVLYVSYRYLSTARCPLCVLKLPILCTVSSYVTSLPPSEPLAPGSSLSPSWVEFLGSNDP